MIQIDKYSLLIKLMILFMISTLSYDLWPISSPNRVIGLLIFLCIIWICCGRLENRKFIILFVACIFIVWTFLVSEDYSRNFTDCIYWLTTILFLIETRDSDFIYQLNDAVAYNRNWIKVSLVLCNILIIIGLFDSGCYGSETWGGGYYIGYTTSAHTLCSGCCIMLVLTLLILKEAENVNIISFIYFIPGIVAILQSGARVFLISVIVICVLFYIYCLRSLSLRIVLAPIAVIVAIYVVLNSGFITKTDAVSTNLYIGDTLLERLTSGRTTFWIIDINAYFNLGSLGQLLGRGFDYVYYVNRTFYGFEIWAHNDVIDCLLSVGLAGTFLYCLVFARCFSGVIFINKKRKLLAVLTILYLTIPMLLNGLFEYQHYLYSAVLLMTFGTRGLSYENSEKEIQIY